MPTAGSLMSLVVVAVVAAAPPTHAGTPAGAVRDAVRSHRRAHATAILREFSDLLSIPNLTSDASGLARNARHIAAMLKRRGFATRLLDGQGGPPVVYGELAAPEAMRTVVIYAHYDGQPVKAADWGRDPWNPVLRDALPENGGREVPFEAVRDGVSDEWRLFARGASDDKAPILALVTAIDALRAAGIPPAVRLKVFFEGEEEGGSPHLAGILKANADLLKADLWLICDGPDHQSRRMQLFFGARGMTAVEITVYGPLRSLHSGHYGNWAPNPAVDLAHLLASLKDVDGRILVPGLMEDVRPPTEAERRALAEVPDVDEELRRNLGFPQSEANNARLADRLMLPAVNVRGLSAGGVGDVSANAIPSEARASIDFRLVPDQRPDRVRAAFEAHLRRQGYHIVHQTPDLATRQAHAHVVKLEWEPGYPAARTPVDLPVSRAVIRVVHEALDQPPVVLPTLGGSLPIYLFADILNVPVIGVPMANYDNDQHAANENIRLKNLWDGIDVLAVLIARLGAADH